VTYSPKGKGIIPFVVEITLNGNQAGHQGKEGEFSVSFTPTTAGQHQISVSHKGRHFKGSPFRIDVVDGAKVVFRRDYSTVGPTLFFNSVPMDQETRNLAIHVLPAIQGVKSLLETAATIECKCLTRQANSCSNSGQREMKMGSFLTHAVSLLTRETTNSSLATIPIIAFKYLMRKVGSFVPLGHQEW